MKWQLVVSPLAMVLALSGLILLCHVVLPPLIMAEIRPRGYQRLMQGPMVGVVTDREVRIWARSAASIP